MKKYIDALCKAYDEGEAKAVFYRLMEDKYNLSRTDCCLGGVGKLSPEKLKQLDHDIERLQNGEPVQYITGFEYFHGLRLGVSDGVLIPRPETEELVDWIVADKPQIRKDRSGKRYILDIGCGSGAIAVSLAKEFEDVSAWDVSDIALRTTRQNAKANEVHVDIYMQDALSAPTEDRDLWDVIVSNPPYVCVSEAEQMTTQVLDHEPHVALFVPDSDPLMFYCAIAEYAAHALRPHGRLYFEINERFGKETCDMIKQIGFTDVELRKDQFGKDRMVRAIS